MAILVLITMKGAIEKMKDDETYTVRGYVSKKTGELFTYQEMLADFAENYDEIPTAEREKYYDEVWMC